MRDWPICVPTLPGMPLSIVVGVVAFVAFFPVTTRAQGAREYLNTAVNSWSGNIEVVFTKAQSASSADVPLPNDLTLSRLTVPYILYSFPLNKKYAGVSLTTPFIRVRAANGTLETAGFTDPGIAFHMNIFGLPALKRDEIAAAIPQTFVSVHLTVHPPIGSYNRNSPLNVGGNRWSFTPLVNLNIPLDQGVQWIEAYASGKFFTNNDQFQGDKQLSQEPLLILTGHYSHNIGERYWASIGTSYDYGGETSVNNVRQNNTANGFRPSVAFSARIGSIRLTVRYENTSTTETAARRNGLVSIRVASLLF